MARSKKSLRKIKGLLFLMLLTMILLITATYAWFSTQRDVEISGMRLNVEVAESMQISLDGEKWTQSIQIANMRQFYGSYTGTGDGFTIYQAKSITTSDGNENYVPTEILPVSSAGEVADGKLKFVQGTVGTNADGTTNLTGITACSEDDLETTATIATRQANNELHPYLVFDMYLRNISAKTTGLDDLLLNEGSSVFVNTATTDDGEQEGAGLGGTGLEYSARVGMIVYGNTLSVTATENAAGDTVGEQIRALAADGNEVAAIWEPNDKEHTAYVVSNNGRGITSTSQVVTTYGIKSAVASATPNEIANINVTSTENSNLVGVNTFKPGYTTVTGGTDDAQIITNTAGNNIGLAPNQISKVRVYVWLEGQDPDCIDLASTGDKLSINLKLTKAETEDGDGNTYVGEGAGSEVAAGTVLTASTLEISEYGKTVTNYASETSDAQKSVNWRIFHTDGTNIYLIADNYINNTYVPSGKGGTAVNIGTYNATYNFYMTDIVEGTDYAGTTDITTALRTKWLSKLGSNANTTYNGKATAYLMDTSKWSGFANSTYADYAMGGPTLELFAASYNETHETYIDTQVVDNGSGYGYELKWSSEEYDTAYGEGAWVDMDYSAIESDDLYIIKDNERAYAYWVASPSNDDDYGVFAAVGDVLSEYAGLVSHYCGNTEVGARPIVCLEDNLQIEKQEDGTYEILPPPPVEVPQ